MSLWDWYLVGFAAVGVENEAIYRSVGFGFRDSEFGFGGSQRWGMVVLGKGGFRSWCDCELV